MNETTVFVSLECGHDRTIRMASPGALTTYEPQRCWCPRCGRSQHVNHLEVVR